MKGGGCLRRLLKEKRGEGFVDVCVLVLSVALVLALVVRIAPVFVAKQNLDVFADELVRTAEINGRVGSATSAKAADLRGETGLDPDISPPPLISACSENLRPFLSHSPQGPQESRRCTGNEQAENGFERQVRAGYAHDSCGGGLLPDSGLRGV